MKPAILRVSAFALVLLGGVCLAADDAAKSAQAEKAGGSGGAQAAQRASDSERAARGEAKGQARASRLTKPWKDMSSLTEEQKKQIAEIHRKSVQDQKVIEEREKADIMALLNDQQKSELKAMQDKETADRKAKAGSKPGSKGPAGEKATKDKSDHDAAAAKQPA